VTEQAPFRKVTLIRPELVVETTPPGERLLRVTQPLSPYPARVCDRLLEFAAATPEATFLARRDETGSWRSISYARALAYAQQLGGVLLARGLSADRPLAILSENSLEHGMLALAALYVGVPFVAISPAYSLLSRDYEKLRYAMRLLTPGLVFASDGERYGAAIEAAVPAETPLVFTRAPSRAGTMLFEELSASPSDLDAAERARDRITPDTLTKFLLTSGSTGMPKAVIHTQRMLTSNLQMIYDCLPFLAEEPPVLVDWLPWHHTFGGNHNYGLVLWNGGSLYIDDGKPTREAFAESAKNLREISPTVYFNVPRGFAELAVALERDADLARSFFARVKMLFYAGAGLSQEIWDRLHAVAARTCGERIVMITGLGMTETSPFGLCANWEAGISGGLGHPSPGTVVKLARIDSKLEVRYRGPHVTPGYWRQPELTRAAFDADGFFRSGDAARFIDEHDVQRGLEFDGRVAEDFKLDTGTWVSVGPLRAKVVAATAPFVQDVVITGRDRPELGALLLLDEPRVRASLPELADAPLAKLAQAPALRSRLRAALDALQREATGSASRITRMLVLSEAPSIDRGEITDKGSINQRAMLESRKALVEQLHGAGAAGDPRVITPSC
jgi:feruloyl-CoA synthase